MEQNVIDDLIDVFQIHWKAKKLTTSMKFCALKNMNMGFNDVYCCSNQNFLGKKCNSDMDDT